MDVREVDEPAAAAALSGRESVASVRGDSDKRVRWTTARVVAARLLILALVLVIWQFASGRLISKFWFSTPSAIFTTLWNWIADGSLWDNLQATLIAMVSGYAIGCVAGISAGLALGLLPAVQRVVSPFITGLYSLPKIALAPLLVIVFGVDVASKVVLVAVTVAFLLLYNTLDGVRDVDHDVVDSLRLMGASTREVITKAFIPATVPWIFVGMRLSVRYAFTAAILGEMIASNKGVGYLIEANAGRYNSTGVFAAIIVIIALSVVMTELLTHAERSRASLNRSR